MRSGDIGHLWHGLCFYRFEAQQRCCDQWSASSFAGTRASILPAITPEDARPFYFWMLIMRTRTARWLIHPDAQAMAALALRCAGPFTDVARRVAGRLPA
jgi:hypothetical protein